MKNLKNLAILETALFEMIFEMFSKSFGNMELREICLEIEIWEGGSLRINEHTREVWLSGDNGTEEISRFTKNFF